PFGVVANPLSVQVSRSESPSISVALAVLSVMLVCVGGVMRLPSPPHAAYSRAITARSGYRWSCLIAVRAFQIWSMLSRATTPPRHVRYARAMRPWPVHADYEVLHCRERERAADRRTCSTVLRRRRYTARRCRATFLLSRPPCLKWAR